MKGIAIILILFIPFNSFTQKINITNEELEKIIQPLEVNIKLLQTENEKLKNENYILNSLITSTLLRLDSLVIVTELSNISLIEKNKLQDSLINQSSKSNEDKILAVDQSLSKNSLYGIIGVLSAVLITGLLFWLLRNRQKIDKSNMLEELSKTKSSIEESLIKEFGKQTELMGTELQLIENQKSALKEIPNVEPDHSLALKVASEINLIERNVNLMDTKTKGLKQLIASVGKLKDNLSANGYEMPEMLGKQFHQGMKVIVTSSIPDENLEKGSEIISKIIIPQVNYNDKMIQTAQIEVSVG